MNITSTNIKTRMHLLKHQRGMTLIELIIVLAIVVILATIAFNLLGGQKDKGLRGEGVSALMLAIHGFEACGRDRGGDYSLCAIPAALVNSVNNRFVVTVAAQNATSYTLSVTRLTGVDEQCTTLSINNLGQKFFTTSDGSGTMARCWSGT
ncbi:MAG: type IV pilin protein [Gammaproteobacteria bacterium]